MTIDALEQFLESHGIEVDLLRKADKIKLLQRWREHFACELHLKTGCSIVRNWDLSVFEKGLLPSVADSQAELEFAKQPLEPCYVIPSDSGPGFFCSSQPPADLNRFCLEGVRPWPLTSACDGLTWADANILVFPTSMDWTLAIHADDCFFDTCQTTTTATAS